MTQHATTGTVERVLINSRFLDETREVHVYLPHNYSPLYKYPTLYINDGSDYMMMGRMISLLNERFQRSTAPRFLVVFVPVDKAKRSREYAPTGDRHNAYVRFFAEELVPKIEEQFAAFPMGAARGILGSSLGGAAALHTLLQYPRRFHYLALQSGSFGQASFAAVSGRKDLATVPIYQVIGLQEEAYETTDGRVLNLLAANRQMHEQLIAQGVEVDYAEYDKEHTWGFWQEDLPRALDHFTKHTTF